MATILQIIYGDQNLSLFGRAVKESDLENKLNEIGPFTVLGPTNLAFRNLTSLSFDQLLLPVNREKLFNLLSGYIMVGKKMLHDFRHEQKLSMLNSKQVMVTVKNGSTLLNGAKILSHNRQGSNGVVHMLDSMYALSQ